MELLYGTKNEGKILVMQRALEPLGITIKGLCQISAKIPFVAETGNSLLENARLKAKAYYRAFQTPVFSCDTGLYLEGLPEKLQPGAYVRRPLGYEMTDAQMTAYYSGLARKFRNLRAQYRNAVLFDNDEQGFYAFEDFNWSWDAFLLPSGSLPQGQAGFPLDSISMQLLSGKYYDVLG